jgi:DNA helicase-2/ATP-dependent DNA helicase PcrA
MEGQVEVLSQSHRIPVLHHTVSQKILHHIQDRRQKDFRPRSYEGTVERYRHSDEVDLSNGSWLLLARTQRQARQLQAEVEQRGYVYTTTGGDTMDMEIVRAVSVWEKLRLGYSVRAYEVRKVYGLMEKDQVKHGYKTLPNIEDNALLSMQELRDYYGLLHDLPWDQGLKKIPEDKRIYLRACMRRGEDLTADPRITVSTIHGAKGAEADHVLLTTDSVGKLVNKLRQSPSDLEDEHRVWYVGLTRARQSLHLINPQRKNGYNVPH